MSWDFSGLLAFCFHAIFKHLWRVLVAFGHEVCFEDNLFIFARFVLVYLRTMSLRSRHGPVVLAEVSQVCTFTTLIKMLVSCHRSSSNTDGLRIFENWRCLEEIHFSSLWMSP
ncbi:hypothetical protein FRC03_011489 [Tulasnella sp. 419]|nr:hypothetical protein FRC03_011489 [Tulasnella sp. 419]